MKTSAMPEQQPFTYHPKYNYGRKLFPAWFLWTAGTLTILLLGGLDLVGTTAIGDGIFKILPYNITALIIGLWHGLCLPLAVALNSVIWVVSPEALGSVSYSFNFLAELATHHNASTLTDHLQSVYSSGCLWGACTDFILLVFGVGYMSK